MLYQNILFHTCISIVFLLDGQLFSSHKLPQVNIYVHAILKDARDLLITSKDVRINLDFDLCKSQ